MSSSVNSQGAGFLYILANPSMPGLVKVGRTNRKPSERAQELSGSTGVPTPFLVVYEVLVSDCNEAEKYIHTVLSNRGYRLSENREFFKAPIPEIINMFMSLPEHLLLTPCNNSGRASDENLGSQSNLLGNLSTSGNGMKPWHNLWEEAESYYFGKGDYLQDRNKAIHYYKESIKLGCHLAYFRLGDIYNCGYDVPKNKSIALEYFSKGAELGNFCCYLHMSAIYHDNQHIDNAIKCLDRYFEAYWNTVGEDFEQLTTLFEGDSFSGFVQICFYRHDLLNEINEDSKRTIRYYKRFYLKDYKMIMDTVEDSISSRPASREHMSRYIENLKIFEAWLLNL